MRRVAICQTLYVPAILLAMTPSKLSVLAGLVVVVAAGIALLVAGAKAAHPGTVNRHTHSAVYHRPASTVRNI